MPPRGKRDTPPPAGPCVWLRTALRWRRAPMNRCWRVGDGVWEYGHRKTVSRWTR